MADHALGPVYYGLKAVRAASSDTAVKIEQEWQRASLPDPVRDLVSSAIEEKSLFRG
jgi:hypothetical protein